MLGSFCDTVYLLALCANCMLVFKVYLVYTFTECWFIY